MNKPGIRPFLPPLLFEPPTRTITVGGNSADIQGFNSDAIQAAADLMPGSGVIRLEAGTFTISAPIRLKSGTTLIGSGEHQTILHKSDGFHSPLLLDADYAELVATVKDPSGFRPGMGMFVIDDDNNSAWGVSTAVITAVEGNTLFFDRYLHRDYREDKNGMVGNACSLIEGIEVQGITVSNLVLDGNGGKNDPLDSCRGGGIYLQKARDCLIENVVVRNFNGDGISYQTDYSITIRNCEVLGCTKNGVHPGAGSYHTIVENCNLHHNGADGLFICWRVKKGTFWKNQMHHNGGSGINIGHRDTDNLFDHNQCYDNALAGIHLRPEKPENAPHRCVFTNNVITNNGGLGHGCGFLIESDAQDMRFETNIFDESGAGRQITGFLFERPLKGCVMIHNTFLGSMHDKELYLAKTEGNLNEANI